MTGAQKVAEEIAEKLVSDYIKSAPHGTLAQHRGHIAAALLAAERRGMLRAAAVCVGWLLSGEMKLRAGEMTAQEKRTAKAIVTAILAAIRREAGEG